MAHASVIGSGPNGLAAAIVLARAGLDVEIFEGETQAGGAARTLPLTFPGYLHDFGSAVHPMAAGSPFFSTLPLESHGLRWIHGPAPLAHPLDDGTAVTLERDLADAEAALGQDGKTWRRIVEPFAEKWPAFAEEILGPVRTFRTIHFCSRSSVSMRSCPQSLLPAAVQEPAHARALRRAGGPLVSGARSASQRCYRSGPRRRSACCRLAGAGGRRAGHHRCTVRPLEELGGQIHLSRRITSLDDLPGLTLCDIAPRQLLAIAGDRLTASYRRSLSRFQPGPGAFKVDYALSEPIPWRARECLRAITVHVGGTMEQIAESEHAMTHGQAAERPFVLVAQPSLFDATRAPAGKHVAWAYCHVPNGSTVDMKERIENQIERFAPGFRECILARHVSTPAGLEAADTNLIGGDIMGGAMSVRQTLSARYPPVRDVGAESLSLLVLHPAGWGSSRDVRLPCGAAGAAQSETLAGVTPPPPDSHISDSIEFKP